ncbi:MAG: preprotein translocase subunit YajC [Bradymonadales bacterium]|nr:preprotein translocase subunit YajC [Bradymonadales bacterium]
MNGTLTFLQALAQAEGGQAAQSDPMSGCLSMLPFFLIVFVILYFMVIRPQKKEQQKQQRFLERLKEGDRVITASGIYGRIVNLEADTVTLDVGDRTRIKFLRSHISRFQVEPERKEAVASAPSKEKPAEESSAGEESDQKRKRRG